MKKNIEKIKKANQLQLEKNFDAAEKLYLEIIEGDSESPDANHNLSILMMTQKRFKEAGLYISKFINTPYPVAEYFHTAASYHEKQNEIESAFKALDRAITISDEKNILKSIELFDVYEGEKIPNDKKSYGIRFTFLDNRKTLTDNYVDKIMNKLKIQFENKFNAQLRK